MDTILQKEVSQQLYSAACHIKDIERLVESDAVCMELIQQIQAIQASLSKAAILLLDSHLNTCLITVMRQFDEYEREHGLQDVVAVFALSQKLNLSINWRFKPMNSKIFTIPNINCGNCVHTVKSEVGSIAGVTRV